LCAVGLGGEWVTSGTPVAEPVRRIPAFDRVCRGVLFAALVYPAAGRCLGWQGTFFGGLFGRGADFRDPRENR
jgi:hypothetical protein